MERKLIEPEIIGQATCFARDVHIPQRFLLIIVCSLNTEIKKVEIYMKT